MPVRGRQTSHYTISRHKVNYSNEVVYLMFIHQHSLSPYTCHFEFLGMYVVATCYLLHDTGFSPLLMTISNISCHACRRNNSRWPWRICEWRHLSDWHTIQPRKRSCNLGDPTIRWRLPKHSKCKSIKKLGTIKHYIDWSKVQEEDIFF